MCIFSNFLNFVPLVCFKTQQIIRFYKTKKKKKKADLETNLLHPCQFTLHRYYGPGYGLEMRGWEDSAGNRIKLEVTKEPLDEGERGE